MSFLDNLTTGVPRLFTERHAKLMYGLCRWLDVRNAVEVGAFHGYCALHIAQAIKENGGGTITVIDDFSLDNDAASIHNNFQRAGLADTLKIISGDSKEVKWPYGIDFAFIDGDHSLDGCVNDCNKAISAGARCLAIHDSVGWWGPREYVEMARKQGEGMWDVFEANHDSGLAVMVKREEKPPVIYSEEEYPSGVA